jgi:bifunctional UDP-N-acetylglucosamine pyrophosphorylase/glucosamine-1-phosphate N-acetyltransferase
LFLRFRPITVKSLIIPKSITLFKVGNKEPTPLNSHLSVIILAAGKGTRMHSRYPKVLQSLAGIPLLQRVIQTVGRLSPEQLLIVRGSAQQPLYEPLLPKKSTCRIDWVYQKEQLGTGHAVSQALAHLSPTAKYVLVLCADMPLITAESLNALIKPLSSSTLRLLTGTFNDPTGFGRIVRNTAGKIQAIIEEKDATPEQRQITEINSGVYAFPIAILHDIIPALTNKNYQEEYYLTDVVSHAVKRGFTVSAVSPQFPEEIQGINTFAQLAQLERVYQKRLAESWLAKGVHILDPNRFDVRGNIDDIHIAPDVRIDVNVILEGKINLSTNVTVGPNVYLKDTVVCTGASVLANSYIEGATIGEAARVGPFARIRRSTHIGAHAGIGNFVEIKESQIGEHSKINHLSYVGDTTVGSHVNIGAGTITCNYDGANKHPTVLEDQASIGAGVKLIAPVVVGQGATVGAGTIVTKDVPAATLLYNRLEICLRSDWQRPKKEAPAVPEEK